MAALDGGHVQGRQRRPWRTRCGCSPSRSVEPGPAIRRKEVRGRSRTSTKMREIVHIQAGQCGNQIGAKVTNHPTKMASRIYDKAATLLNLAFKIGCGRALQYIYRQCAKHWNINTDYSIRANSKSF